MRDVLTTLLELAGLVLVVAGVAMLSVPAAWITAGVGLIGVGALAGRPPKVVPESPETAP